MLTKIDQAKSALSGNSELDEKESLKSTDYNNNNCNAYNTDDCNRHYRQKNHKKYTTNGREKYYALGGTPWKASQRKRCLS